MHKKFEISILSIKASFKIKLFVKNICCKAFKFSFIMQKLQVSFMYCIKPSITKRESEFIYLPNAHTHTHTCNKTTFSNTTKQIREKKSMSHTVAISNV